jgi:hypothetical protein
MSPTSPSDDMPESHSDARTPRARGLGRLRREREPAEPHRDDDTDLWVRMLTPTSEDEERVPLRRPEAVVTDITNTASALRRDQRGEQQADPLSPWRPSGQHSPTGATAGGGPTGAAAGGGPTGAAAGGGPTGADLQRLPAARTVGRRSAPRQAVAIKNPTRVRPVGRLPVPVAQRPARPLRFRPNGPSPAGRATHNQGRDRDGRQRVRSRLERAASSSHGSDRGLPSRVRVARCCDPRATGSIGLPLMSWHRPNRKA